MENTTTAKCMGCIVISYKKNCKIYLRDQARAKKHNDC